MHETQEDPHEIIEQSNWPMPDWRAIAKAAPKSGAAEYWLEQGANWVSDMAAHMGEPYEIYESPQYWMISAQPKNVSIEIIKWVERTHRSNLKLLGPLARKASLGKGFVIVLSSQKEYYSYISNYYPEGEFGGSSGCYLSKGYGHFAFPHGQYANTRGIIAHELAHALLERRDIPKWLNEGIAQLCEEQVSGYLNFDHEKIREHIDSYWNSQTIQGFWSGKSFSLPDEGQTLSYHLAQLLVRRLIRKRKHFDAFASKASALDSGEYMLRNAYGISLQDLAEIVLGDGDWSYQPERSKG